MVNKRKKEIRGISRTRHANRIFLLLFITLSLDRKLRADVESQSIQFIVIVLVCAVVLLLLLLRV